MSLSMPSSVVLLSVNSEKSASSSSKDSISLLKQRLKKEKEAHENTEFRLKVRVSSLFDTCIFGGSFAVLTPIDPSTPTHPIEIVP